MQGEEGGGRRRGQMECRGEGETQEVIDVVE